MIIKLFINRRSVGLFLFYGYNKNKICIDHCLLRTNLTFDFFFSSCSSILKFEMKKNIRTQNIYTNCAQGHMSIRFNCFFLFLLVEACKCLWVYYMISCVFFLLLFFSFVWFNMICLIAYYFEIFGKVCACGTVLKYRLIRVRAKCSPKKLKTTVNALQIALSQLDRF